ncbi:MAG: DUF2520 domain-containing protein [Thermoleophilia bacterium]
MAAAIEPGPWLCHVSGATRVRALAPHARRFGLHPLQTFQVGLGPTQLDGAWGALTAETTEAREAGLALAALLGLTAFDLADEGRPAYHAGAVMASGFLTTLHGAAAALVETAGAPREALEPLMRRTMENGFLPTGPHVRGDRETIDAHLAAIRELAPELERLYLALGEATERLLRT